MSDYDQDAGRGAISTTFFVIGAAVMWSALVAPDFPPLLRGLVSVACLVAAPLLGARVYRTRKESGR